ncbi:hypothetical protein H9645_04630 [Luteimonas sp. Sa2BVA3]|uniref:VCBS repeat-containing protein n=1 Tax=Luteimonas colneyensis TaxID=2762230 RepID=A0ABR8UH04_9GAMM|nr:hypothetical protein [Luteimonas colneyensis]MBD7987308.1 hypothetical protein [Luteimonas colneyensis]
MPAAPDAATRDAAAEAAVAVRVVAGDPNAMATVLPADVARGLSTDARVLDCPDGVIGGRSAFGPDWVVAHPLDFNGDGRDDWLVEGRHRCLSGEDGADWWAYVDEGAAARLVGALGRARAIQLLPARAPQFADLQLERGDGGPQRLRYEAGAYVPAGAAAD